MKVDDNLFTSFQGVEELLNAYYKHDYVEMGIKLIEIKFNVDPPEQYSNEQLQLLILRHLLIKVHPYYLFWFPSKRPPNGPDHFDHDTSTQISLHNCAKPIGQALDFLDFGTQQISDGIDSLIGLGSSMIKSLMPTKKSEDAKNKGVTNDNSLEVNENQGHNAASNTENDKGNSQEIDQQQSSRSDPSSNALSNIFNTITKTALQTAGAAMAALVPHDDIQNGTTDLHDIEYALASTAAQTKKVNSSNLVEDKGVKGQHAKRKGGEVRNSSEFVNSDTYTEANNQKNNSSNKQNSTQKGSSSQIINPNRINANKRSVSNNKTDIRNAKAGNIRKKQSGFSTKRKRVSNKKNAKVST